MKFIIDIFKGVMIGIANIIPGVSGGTMAVSMGIYDKILGAVTNLFRQFKKSILTLLPYIVGMLLAIVGVSRIIEVLFQEYPLPTASAFVGLILGGLPMILKKVKFQKKQVDVVGILLFVAFFALILILPNIGNQKDVLLHLSAGTVIRLFLVGVIASATMVIPGVSGSMVLMCIGYYNPIITIINQCVDALVAFDLQGLLKTVSILIPFGIGVVIGIFAIAKLIEYLLKQYEKKTYYAILGLVTASPFAIYMSIGVGVITLSAVVTSIVMFLIGFVVAYRLGE